MNNMNPRAIRRFHKIFYNRFHRQAYYKNLGGSFGSFNPLLRYDMMRSVPFNWITIVMHAFAFIAGFSKEHSSNHLQQVDIAKFQFPNCFGSFKRGFKTE